MRLTLSEALQMVTKWQGDHLAELTDLKLIVAFSLVILAAYRLWYLREQGVIPKEKLAPIEKLGR